MGCYTSGDGATHHTGCQCHEARHEANLMRVASERDRHLAELAKLRAEVENAEEASKLASRIVAETIARAEKAEVIITKARKRMAALNDALEDNGHDETTDTGILAARVNAELWPHEPLRTALAAGERE
jgi:hypothetical protein